MKKNILSNYLANRIVLIIAIVYFFLSGSVYLFGLGNNTLLYNVLQGYEDTAMFKKQELMLFLISESLLHMIMLAGLVMLWIRPRWMFFLTIVIVNLMLSLISLYLFKLEALRTLIVEWFIIVLVGISFSALVLSHLIKLRTAARKLASMGHDAADAKAPDKHVDG